MEKFIKKINLKNPMLKLYIKQTFLEKFFIDIKVRKNKINDRNKIKNILNIKKKNIYIYDFFFFETEKLHQ